MEKYSKQIIITIILLFSLSFIGRGQTTPVEFEDILNENELPTSSLTEKANPTGNNSYNYEDFHHQLQSEGIIITKVQNNNILSQIFPRSKFWQFTNKKGQNLYLADGGDKTEINVVNDQTVTDKLVDFDSVEIDFDRDGVKELVTLSAITFKDVALCCNLKQFLAVFEKNSENNWQLYKEKELDVYYGGEQNGAIKTLIIKDLFITEITTEGSYYNGLKMTLLSWFIWRQDNLKQIWREYPFYNTDIVGTFPEEAMDNYQAHYQLEYINGEKYPRIKFVRIYTKKQGKKLTNPEEEVIYYMWNQDKQMF